MVSLTERDVYSARWAKPTIQRSPAACHQLSSRSTRPAANQISVLSSPGSIRPQPESLIGCDGWVKASNQRGEANSSDSVETEVMEAPSSLPPLFAIQSHSLSQNTLLLSNRRPLPDRLLKSLSPPPLGLSLFLPLSLSILIINWGDETGFTCKAIPNGSFGCC